MVSQKTFDLRERIALDRVKFDPVLKGVLQMLGLTFPLRL
jgi:hypothetical protein